MKSLIAYGKSLVGKTAQSRLLTYLDDNGKQFICAPQKITGYEIVTSVGESHNPESTLLVTLGGESIFEEFIYNIN